MKRLVTLLFFLPVFAVAQHGAEIGLMGGVHWYNGELNPARQFHRVKPVGGIIFRHNFNYRYSFRFTATHGHITASDFISTDPFSQQRGHSFRSPVTEVAAGLEFNFLPYMIGSGTYPFSTYVFGGLSVFRFNPQSAGTTDFINVPNEPEKEYALIQPAIPFGFGMKISLFGRLGLFLEWGMRKTFTDYLDDVSTTWNSNSTLIHGRQRGNSRNKDWFSFAGGGLVLLLTKKNVCPAYNRGI